MSIITVDLHLHSTASDGELPPAKLVAEAKKAGLEVIALTDHDSIEGLGEASEAAKNVGIQIVPGCELTCYHRNIEIHVLALFMNTGSDSIFTRMLNSMRAARPARVFAMAAKLRELGVPLEDDALKKATGDSGAPGRVHVALALLHGGFVSSIDEAFIRYLRPGAPAYIPKAHADPRDTLSAIHEAGGIAIVAHPGQYHRDEIVSELFAFGLDGLEVFHPSHREEDTRRYLAMAETRQKLITGGSDYHGLRVKPSVGLGCSGLTTARWQNLCQKAGK